MPGLAVGVVKSVGGGAGGGSGISALTGDVTASGSGSQAATIAANAVTNAKAAQMAPNSIKCNATGSTANAADCTALPAVDISAGTVLATGSSLARTSAARAAEVFNVLDYCTTACTSTADQTAAILAMTTAVNAGSGNVEVRFPAGAFTFSNGGTPFTFTVNSVCLRGSGPGPTLIFVTGGAGVKWSQTVGGCLENVRFYATDAISTGSQVTLDRAQYFNVTNVETGGGLATGPFTGLEILTGFEIHVNNYVHSGTNATTGAAGALIHRFSSGSSNSSTIFFDNFDIVGSTQTGLTNAIVVENCDGCVFHTGHAGFTKTRGAGMLIQPQYAADKIAGLDVVGVDFDTVVNGVDFEPFAGSFTGANVAHKFTGVLFQNASLDGVVMNDPAVQNVVFTGSQVGGNNQNGFNIQAGTNISVIGGTFSNDNAGNLSASHINVGAVLGMVISGVAYNTGAGAHDVLYNVNIGSTANTVTIGPSSYQNGTANVNITAGATGIFQVSDMVGLTALFAAPPAIGGTTRAAGAFTALSQTTGLANSGPISFGSMSSAASPTQGVGIVNTGSPIYTDTSGTGGTIFEFDLNAPPSVKLETSTTTTYTNVYGWEFSTPTCSTGGGGTPTCGTLWALGSSGPVNFKDGIQTEGGPIQIGANSNFNINIGTGTDANAIVIGGGSNGVIINGNAAGSIKNTALISTGTKFTIAGTGCTPTTTTGGAATGLFTLATGPCTSVTVTINGATGLTAPTGWSCPAHDRTAPTVLIGGESSSSATTATFTIPAGAGTADVISYSCTGF